MNARVRLARALWLSVALVVVVNGCGSGGTGELKRSVTSGKVTFAGKPIEEGQIRFLPSGGPPTQGHITRGAYSINTKGGVPVGQSRVEIDSYEASGKEMIIGADKKKIKEAIQVLPPKFNTKSELTVEIKPNKTNVHDFDLKP